MKTLKLLLLVLCLTAASSFAQQRGVAPVAKPIQSSPMIVDRETGQTLLCKGATVPDGFAISGEMFSDACNGPAWIVKRKAPSPPALDRTFGTALGLSWSEPNEVIAAGQCEGLQQTIKNTYNFKPALLDDAQMKARSASLDVFWNQVRQSQATLVPCLRKALKEEKSGSFFNIDGSMLLVELDPSPASKALQVKKFIKADLAGTDLEYWVKTMARRGVEGFDTSEAGAKWLSYPDAKYKIAAHGDFPVGAFAGAVFIFGSVQEDFATPVLLRIANDLEHSHRVDALSMLMSQATPASFRALKEVNTSGLPAHTSASIRDLLDNPKLLKPRAQPKLTREENIRAFQGIVDGDYSAFRELVLKAPDGEADAVATLRAEDIPLVRRARRASIARCNQHAISDYASFTQILWALAWKAEFAK